MSTTIKRNMRINRELTYQHNLYFESICRRSIPGTSFFLEEIEFTCTSPLFNLPNVVKKRLNEIGSIFYKESLVLLMDIVEGEQRYLLMPKRILNQRYLSWLKLDYWLDRCSGKELMCHQEIKSLAEKHGRVLEFIEVNYHLSSENTCLATEVFGEEDKVLQKIHDCLEGYLDGFKPPNDYCQFMLEEKMDPLKFSYEAWQEKVKENK